MTEIAPSTRWDNQYDNINENEDDWEGGNNSAKLFERSRIKALAGMPFYLFTHDKILILQLKYPFDWLVCTRDQPRIVHSSGPCCIR